MLNITAQGLNLIKHFEGCKLRAYKCPAGVWTIGYGHTGPDVHGALVINQVKADSLLAHDVARFEEAVRMLVRVDNDLTTGQFDALVSFAYNCGAGNLEKSTLLKLVNAKRFDAAAAEFGKWVNAGGKPLPGLVKRREAEAGLFRTGQFKVPA